MRLRCHLQFFLGEIKLGVEASLFWASRHAGPHFFFVSTCLPVPRVPAVVTKLGELVSQMILNLLCADVFDILLPSQIISRFGLH